MKSTVMTFLGTLRRSGARKSGAALLSALLAGAWLGTGCTDLLGIDIDVPVSLCGDGMLDESAGEQCDHGGDSDTCDRDCSPARCGDGLYNPLAGEQCDEGRDSATCDLDCTLPRCGDRYVNTAAGEACDQGVESAACDRDCSLPDCGDGIANALAGETCDDGNHDPTDACTTDCKWAECGDGHIHAGIEACDDGDDDDDDECMTWCEAPECMDGLRNGGETDVDCGAACDAACGAGQSCAGDGDCASGTCRSGRCVTVRLAAGHEHTCALLAGGEVRCWGRNASGQLGHGRMDPIGDDEAPSSVGVVDVGGPVVQLAAGASHTCALLAGGAVRCWGESEDGRLGHGHANPIGDDEVPSSVDVVDVGGHVVQLATGGWHTCALLAGGAVRCWGLNSAGQLGYGHIDSVGDGEAPASVDAVDVGGPVVQLTAGNAHTCALLAGGVVRCWGYNGSGQLGYGHWSSIGDQSAPSTAGDVNVGGRVVQLVAGHYHTCALLESGGVRCWGSNQTGQLGHGHTVMIGGDELPASTGDVHVGGRAVQLAAGGYHTCALLDDGALRCWGNNASGQLGQGHENTIADDELPDSVDPVDVGGHVVEIAAGAEHTCALLDDGALRCWGNNASGQLGQARTEDIGDIESPAAVPPVSYR